MVSPLGTFTAIFGVSVEFSWLKPKVEKRMPVKRIRDEKGQISWVTEDGQELTDYEVPLNEEMKKMKVIAKGKRFEGFFDVKGTLLLTEEGIIAIKMPIHPSNPDLFNIALLDLMDFFEGIYLKVYVNGKEYAGQFQEDPDNEEGLILLNSENTNILPEILKEHIGKEVSIIGLKNHLENGKPNTEYPYSIYFKDV